MLIDKEKEGGKVSQIWGAPRALEPWDPSVSEGGWWWLPAAVAACFTLPLCTHLPSGPNMAFAGQNLFGGLATPCTLGLAKTGAGLCAAPGPDAGSSATHGWAWRDLWRCLLQAPVQRQSRDRLLGTPKWSISAVGCNAGLPWGHLQLLATHTHKHTHWNTLQNKIPGDGAASNASPCTGQLPCWMEWSPGVPPWSCLFPLRVSSRS